MACSPPSSISGKGGLGGGGPPRLAVTLPYFMLWGLGVGAGRKAQDHVLLDPFRRSY